jgi:hypothetical protein
MNELKINKSELKLASGGIANISYNETDDILEIVLNGNKPATGIELTDNILLRVDRKTGQAASLTILHFSILTERTEFGPRSYALDNLDELPEDLRELVLRIISTPPVNQFLKLSHFQESPTKRVPFTYVEPYQFAS